MPMTEMNQEAEGTQEVPAYTQGMEGSEQGGDPEAQKRVQAYTSVLIKIMHSKETRDGLIDMLAGGEKEKAPGPAEGSEGMPREQKGRTNDPFIAVPQAAVVVNDMALAFMKDNGIEVDFGTQLAGSATVISDIIQLGYAKKIWPELSQEEVAGIYEDALQIVIERGLKDGSIDPIQLQADVEPLMNEDQKGIGNQMAEKGGLGSEPSQQAMTEQYAQGQVRQTKAGFSKENAEKKQQALGGQ